MQFRTALFLGGKTATGFEVPAEVVESFGKGKRVPVVVTVKGYSYRSTVAVMGGKYLLPFAAEHREATGLNAGDEVDLNLELDEAPRKVEVPAEFQAALDANPVALTKFQSLSYSQKRQHTLAVEGAKTDDTRTRRIAKAIETLGAG